MSEYHLFDVYGIEVEYMIVDQKTLDVRPFAPTVLRNDFGETVNTLEDGEVTWSNELAAHVVELKTTVPVPSLDSLPKAFHRSLSRLRSRLPPGATLMPGAAHPWMDPEQEFVRWEDDDAEVYAAFDRIFDCRGHGWANLQSIHVNLPFSGDSEFHRLHEAIRHTLPLIPGLSAASPVLDGQLQPEVDSRLRHYSNNARRVPNMTALVIPESVQSRVEYESRILLPLYDALAPHDPDGVLRHEWANARGAIARFDRSAIEIRIIDAQECPRMDMAVAAAVVALVRDLSDRGVGVNTSAESTEELAELMQRTQVDGEAAVIDGRSYLAKIGIDGTSRTAGEVWGQKLEHLGMRSPDSPWRREWELLLEEGPLARRILAALPSSPAQSDLRRTWRRLVDGLASDVPFSA